MLKLKFRDSYGLKIHKFRMVTCDCMCRKSDGYDEYFYVHKFKFPHKEVIEVLICS